MTYKVTIKHNALYSTFSFEDGSLSVMRSLSLESVRRGSGRTMIPLFNLFIILIVGLLSFAFGGT